MTIDKTLYKLRTSKFDKKHIIFSVSFYTPYDNCFGITVLRVILHTISEVKYHFDVRFSICNV